VCWLIRLEQSIWQHRRHLVRQFVNTTSLPAVTIRFHLTVPRTRPSRYRNQSRVPIGAVAGGVPISCLWAVRWWVTQCTDRSMAASSSANCTDNLDDDSSTQHTPPTNSCRQKRDRILRATAHCFALRSARQLFNPNIVTVLL